MLSLVGNPIEDEFKEKMKKLFIPKGYIALWFYEILLFFASISCILNQSFNVKQNYKYIEKCQELMQ